MIFSIKKPSVEKEFKLRSLEHQHTFINFLYIQEPVVDMREHPSVESKIVSQAIFSEKITVEKEERSWVSILTSDGYAGWIPSNSFTTLKEPYKTSLKISRLAAHLYERKEIEYGPVQTLPYGSQLQSLDITDLRWIQVGLPNGKKCYIQKGDVAPEIPMHGKDDLVKFSQQFLGLPYTWGGRSSFGYDCSGFIQMLYYRIGIHLPRDSCQQVLDPRFRPIPLNKLEKGDLIFFGKSEQQIGHVGMSLGQGQFIHATARENQPWVRVSNLSDLEWSGHYEVHYPYRVACQLI